MLLSQIAMSRMYFNFHDIDINSTTDFFEVLE